MEGPALESLHDSVYQPPSGRAASTADTRQQLLQLLPFISEKLDAQASNSSSNCQPIDSRPPEAADAGPALKEQPRLGGSSWSMTSNTLQGQHDVSGLSLPGQRMVLSSDTNSLLASAVLPTQQQHHSLDLSTLSHHPHAHASAPTNTANQSQARPASMSALQHYINGSSITRPINDMQQLPPRADTPLDYPAHVPGGNLDLSPSQLSHARRDVPNTHMPPHHFMGMPLSSMSCPNNPLPLSKLPPQPRQTPLHRLHLQSSPAAHQFLPPPSSRGSASMPQAASTVHRWPARAERFPPPLGSMPHEYHQSAPEHAASSFPTTVSKAVDAHLQAYISPPLANGMPHPGDVPGLSSAAASSEMHLARLTLDSLPDPADSAVPLAWQQRSVPVHGQAVAVPPQALSPHKSPDWCVVTGLMLAPGHVRPPEQMGPGSVTTMLVWPPGIRSALQCGQLCLTLDPTELECRGSACLPSLMFCCPHADERAAMTSIKGVYRRDMFHGRADLPEHWRMPHGWETDSGEVTLQDMAGVRLVLSRHGFSLLPSAASATFLCMQSLIMVLGSPSLASLSTSSNRMPYGDPAFSSIEDAPGRYLLWEVARSATSVGAQLQSLPHESRGSGARASPIADTSRGGWLQRLNHEKQKQDLTVEWHDRQLSDLTWISTLLVNGGPVNSSDPCVKKQDARDGAARSYLATHGTCE